MSEQLGRLEIRLSPAGAKANEMIAVQRAYKRVLFSLIHVLRNVSYDRSV